MYGVGEKSIFFTALRKSSIIFLIVSNRILILYCDGIASFDKRAYTGSLFMWHGDAGSILQKLKSNLKYLDYTNKLMQVSMDNLNVSWKLYYTY